MLSQRRGKKIAKFRQLTHREIAFSPSEGKCPRTKRGLINRNYSAKCKREIEAEDAEIAKMKGENYEEKKEAYIAKLLKETRQKTKRDKQAEVNKSGLLIYERDTVVETKRLEPLIARLLENTTIVSLRETLDDIFDDGSFNVIQKNVLLTICYGQMKKFEKEQSIGDTERDLKSITMDEVNKLDFDSGTMDLIEDPFNPLVGAFELDILERNGQEHFKMPFDTGEDITPMTEFFDEFIEVQQEKWYAEQALGNKKYYEFTPEDPFMFYMFITDEENRKVLAPQIGGIVDALKRKHNDGALEDWEPEVRTKKNKVREGGRKEMADIDYPDYDSEGEEKVDDSILEVYPYSKKKKASTDAEDLSQGLSFSNFGKEIFVLLLSTTIVRSARDVAFKGLVINPKTNYKMWCLRAYEWLCVTQENHFKTYKEWVPYSLSEFGASGGIFPDILLHQLQSLKNLNVRLIGNRPICSACAKGFETYYGASAIGVNKKRPKGKFKVGQIVYFKGTSWNKQGIDHGTVETVFVSKKDGRLKLRLNYGWSLQNIKYKRAIVDVDKVDYTKTKMEAANKNTTGICTKMVEDYLDGLELTDEEKNNPWYIQWVGTYEQAARRIERFKAKQAEMYDNNDPNYDFVYYYAKLIILNLDYWVKRMFNVCNVKVDESGDEHKELSDEEASYWATILKEINDRWKGAAVGAAAGGIGAAGVAAAGALAIGTGGIAPATLAAIAAGGAAAGALLGAGGKKLIGKIWTVIKAGGMLLYKLFTMILQMPFVLELIIDMVQEYKKKICREMAIETNHVTLRKTGDKGDTKQFNEMTGKWLSLTKADKAEQAKAIAKASSDKFWGNVNKFQAALSSLSGPDGDGILKRTTDALSLNGPNSPIKKIFTWITTIPGVASILKKLEITPDNLSVMITTALMRTGTKTWNTMMAANSGVGRVMRLYDSITGDGGCLDTNGNLVLTDGGDASQGAQYKAYAFEQAIHNIPYYAIMLINAMHKDGDCRLSFNSSGMIDDQNWAGLYALYSEDLIMQQILPCGHPAHKQLDNENWHSLKKEAIAFYETQLALYIESKEKREYGYQKDGSLESEQKFDFLKNVAGFKPEPPPVQIKKLKEEATKGWSYWQIAGLAVAAAAGVGIVVATGGFGAAAAASLNSAVATGASTIASGATAIGTTVAANAQHVKDVVTTNAKSAHKFVAKHSAKVMEQGYKIVDKVSNSYAGKAIGDAITRKIGDEILDFGQKCAENPAAVAALMYTGGNILLGSVQTAITTFRNNAAQWSVLSMSKVFSDQPDWEKIFKRKLQVQVSKLIGVTDNDATIQQQHQKKLGLPNGPIQDLDYEQVFRIKRALTKCTGLVITFNDDIWWWFVDLKGTADFFEGYAQPQVFMQDV